MSADQLLQYTTWVLFVLVFLFSVLEATRRPLRANFDIALLFLAPTLVILVELAEDRSLLQPSDPVQAVCDFLILVLPYLLLRLVDDFSEVPRTLLRLAEAWLVAVAVGLLVLVPPRPAWYSLPATIYFVALQLYVTAAFARESGSSSGATRRRMQAVALGSMLLGLATAIGSLIPLLPARQELLTGVTQVLALGYGICYFLGFAPPAWLRQSWQATELRAFLGEASRLSRLPDTDSLLREVEGGAAASLGAPVALIARWDEATQQLRLSSGGRSLALPPDESLAAVAFAAQEAMLSTHAWRDHPFEAKLFGGPPSSAVLAAPITAQEKRLGVLVAYSPRAPMFVQDDLALLQLLADQAALLLQSRALIDEAARLRARVEIARLKEDFLSAAAHDLKTPITAVLAQAQLLELRAAADPAAPPDLVGIQRLVRQARRMRALVDELLDASQVAKGRLVGTRERVDLVEIVEGICARPMGDHHRCVVEAEGSVVGRYDRGRIAQLVENLVENAMKFSPAGGDVVVRVWRQGKVAHLTVSDQGIGIPAGDLPHVFERFYRGANVDDRRFAGMGLGLFISRLIVEGHGGRIEATSTVGRGSTIHVSLPAAASRARRSAA